MNSQIPTNKLHKFLAKVQKMADKEFGVSDCGDSWIEVSVVNRQTHEHMPFMSVPYTHLAENMDRIMHVCVGNLGMAYSRLDSAMKIADTHKQMDEQWQRANVFQKQGYDTGRLIKDKKGTIWLIWKGACPSDRGGYEPDSILVGVRDKDNKYGRREYLRIDTNECELVPQ